MARVACNHQTSLLSLIFLICRSSCVQGFSSFSHLHVGVQSNGKSVRPVRSILQAQPLSSYAIDIDEKPQFPIGNRGKVNEIDFCIAPSDVSLSRAYAISKRGDTSEDGSVTMEESDGNRRVSLTKVLNTVSNRAVRRVLLSRSWPSPEALNASLRKVLSTNSSALQLDPAVKVKTAAAGDEKDAKCPVPRPILDAMMSKANAKDMNVNPGSMRSQKGGGFKTDEEWIEEQKLTFREKFSSVPGFSLAEAYFDCILNLATSGVESPRVAEVLAAGVYDESYRRVLSVLQSVGTEFVVIPDTNPPLSKIAPKLIDQDICLSMIDALKMKNEKRERTVALTTVTEVDDTADIEGENDNSDDNASTLPDIKAEVVEEKEETETKNEPSVIDEDDKENGISMQNDDAGKNIDVEDVLDSPGKKKKRFKLLFWKKDKKDLGESNDIDLSVLNQEAEAVKSDIDEKSIDIDTKLKGVEEVRIEKEDLVGVLLNAEDITMTRQLNSLSNIVQRALLFGGDQELYVLYRTMEADKAAFVEKWYPGTGGIIEKLDDEQRPGIQYLNSMLQLLKDCYEKGVVMDLLPGFTMNQSFRNSYERLTCSLVELGSGYVRLAASTKNAPIPKSAQEELGRFAQWESTLRKTIPDVSPYPDDMIGDWVVKDEIGGKTIGASNVTFAPMGLVDVAFPMEGLRWKLDPGPTHLDTCTFQVLGDDGAILQYKGFVDRGARLESRFSKRPLQVRGIATFQMRDSDTTMIGEGYSNNDLLPINVAYSSSGTTRFVMTKALNN